MEKILISACLLGQIVRYDAKKIEVDHRLLRQWQQESRLVPVCPEVEGGLAVPRPAAEIDGGDGALVLAEYARVITADGEDLTERFLRGARAALHLARKHQIRMAILKENSPSCGSQLIYDGSFSGRKVKGSGVTTTLLENNRIKVFNEYQIEDAAIFLQQLERK